MDFIINEILDLFVGVLYDGLMLFGIDIKLINLSIGFYTDWVTITLYDGLSIVVAILVWLFIIKITWAIFKGIFRRVKTW